MDPLTHATLGATAALCKSRHKSHIYPAILCGVLAGLFPDIDILIHSADNPMLGLKYHRHFTHSLAFVPLGALIVASFLHFTLLRKYSFRRTYVFCLFGMGCHGLLDSMTNYGTHWLLPLSGQRESWSNISIIDPIFTITLLCCVILCRILGTPKPAYIAMGFAVCYWTLGFVQKEIVTHQLKATAEARGHKIARYKVKPSLGNIVLWRGQYLHKGKIYIDAYHSSPWAGLKTYEGSSYPLFKPDYDFYKRIGNTQRRDFEYFTFFSDGWVSAYPAGQDMVSDMRFANIPNEITPLWGIRFYPEDTTRHVSYETDRQRNDGDFAKLWSMIKGQ